MRLTVASALFCLIGLAASAPSAMAKEREAVERDGWTISAQSDGRGACSLEQISAEGLFRYSSDGRVTVAGGTIGEIDTRRAVSLVVSIDGRTETVRATASRVGEGYAYTFTPRRRPSFTQGFDLAVLRADEIVFQVPVKVAAVAYDELLDCASNPFWPEPF